MFEKIDRIAIAVKDLEKAADFFSDLLGIEFDIVGSSEQLGMRGGYSACGLELIESTHPDSIIGRFLEQRGEGLWALVLKVRDMDQMIKRFEEKGLKVAGDVKVGAMREVAFHPKGSYGVEIVLAEYPEKHPATVAAMSREA
jgi:catechol 2,3-dioxygenase-like lactoylglutathione lyase family enzyme